MKIIVLEKPPPTDLHCSCSYYYKILNRGGHFELTVAVLQPPQTEGLIMINRGRLVCPPLLIRLIEAGVLHCLPWLIDLKKIKKSRSEPNRAHHRVDATASSCFRC